MSSSVWKCRIRLRAVTYYLWTAALELWQQSSQLGLHNTPRKSEILCSNTHKLILSKLVWMYLHHTKDVASQWHLPMSKRSRTLSMHYHITEFNPVYFSMYLNKCLRNLAYYKDTRVLMHEWEHLLHKRPFKTSQLLKDRYILYIL